MKSIDLFFKAELELFGWETRGKKNGAEGQTFGERIEGLGELHVRRR